MMRIPPGLWDKDENLEATIRCMAEHGGRFVVAGGLALADQQRAPFWGVLRERFPDLLPLYEQMYPHPTTSYGGIRTGDPHAIGRCIRDLCRQYSISDRMPRPIIPDDKQALNKRWPRSTGRWVARGGEHRECGAAAGGGRGRAERQAG